MSERKRAYLYRVAGAVGALLLAYGIVSASELAEWLNVVGAVLAVGGNGLATRYTSTRRKDVTNG